LSDELFARDAVCFLNARSRLLRFEQADGSAISMDFSDFEHAALWMRPHAPFLCLEAWTGYSDPEGFAGDLFEKPSMRVLMPGQTARHAAVYRYFARP
jgi:galactose mutarotase-like enzyme